MAPPLNRNAMMIAVAAAAASLAVSHATTPYAKLQRAVLPWAANVGRAGGGCGGGSSPCNVTALALACDATPTCNAFNTNGWMFSCPNARCDCDAGQDYCLRGLDIYSSDPSVNFGSDRADTWVRAGNPAPSEWASLTTAGRLLWGSPEFATDSLCYMPEVGNGYLASSVGWGAMHVAGLFNGKCGNVEKVRLPSTTAVTIEPAEASASVAVIGGGLDMEAGVYRRRLTATTALNSSVSLEQRIYAHRTRKNVLLLEVEVLAPGLPPADSLLLNLTTLWAPTPGGGGSGRVPGDGCAGPLTQDITFLGNATVDGSNATVFDARTTRAGDAGELWNISFVVELTAASTLVQFTGESSTPLLQFITVVSTSLDGLAAGQDGSTAAVHALALASYSAAAIARANRTLFAEHVAGWRDINAAGIEVEPASSDPADVARALDIATHASSAFYYLSSSVREGWAAGVSPGGISSGSYSGAVFMDQDLWMTPGLYFLAPQLAETMLQFRFASLRTEAAIAALFGYNGSMVAWTAGYEGRLYGCCEATGGYEDCLEQHVTGAVAWAAWQMYASSGNTSWLSSTGYPILSAAADFHASRVSSTGNGSYSVRGVLPMDEWCVGSGCGCESPGVDDDAETNAVVRLSLLLAARAAEVLGVDNDHTRRWAAVGEGVLPLFNATGGHHNQFNSPLCPGGWGGSHYTTAHTVCPEDVNLLTYPFGDALSISRSVALADALLFVPLTCKENAGMTTPMHTVLWLYLADDTEANTTNTTFFTYAMAEFNRSMHAAAYGPFNVRNEVDKHADIPGGHFDNTKFLTGDGGFLQALLNGFGGLRLVNETALKLLRPSLPESVGRLVLRSLSWHGRRFTLSINASHAVFEVLQALPVAVTLRRGGCTLLQPGQAISVSRLDASEWPAVAAETCAG